jgi:hypothetical protein
VEHTCNPSYSRGRGRKIAVEGQPRKKVREILSPRKLNMVVHTYYGSRVGKISVQGRHFQKLKTEKRTKRKRTRVVP